MLHALPRGYLQTSVFSFWIPSRCSALLMVIGSEFQILEPKHKKASLTDIFRFVRGQLTQKSFSDERGYWPYCKGCASLLMFKGNCFLFSFGDIFFFTSNCPCNRWHSLNKEIYLHGDNLSFIQTSRINLICLESLKSISCRPREHVIKLVKLRDHCWYQELLAAY